MARQLLFCCLSAAINQPPTLLELLADDLRLGLCRNAAQSPFSCLLNGPPSGCWPWNPLFAPPFSLSESGVPKSSWRSLIPEAKIPPCSIKRWLGLAWFEFHYCGKKPPPDNAITLVSGSYPFLQRAASNSGLGRKIFLLDEPWRRKIEPNPSYGFIWKILLPSQFGSSTDFPFLVGFSGFPFAPRGSSLARNIGHILDHSIRPLPLAASEVESMGHLDSYVSDSLLDPRFLDRPVAYQTSYYSSQWGVACSRPRKSVFRLVCLGASVLEDFTRRCSPLCRSKCWGFALTHLEMLLAVLLQPLSTPGPQVFHLVAIHRKAS
jgi:hypothetical protein